MSGRRSDPASMDIGQLCTGYCIYCITTAEFTGADEVALFVHADDLQVPVAFAFDHGRAAAHLVSPAGLHTGLDAFDDAEQIEVAGSSLDSADLPDKFEPTSFAETLGPGLHAVMEAQDLREAAIYLRQDGVDAELAIKVRDDELFRAIGPAGTFERAFEALEQAEEEIHVVDGSEGIAFPDEPWRPTSSSVVVGTESFDKRTIRLTAGAEWALREQHRLFVEKFGREPASDDPLFFNPDADEPEPLTPEQEQEMDTIWEELGMEEHRQRAEARLEEHGLVSRTGPKPEDEAPCPCGSGVEYKRCHGR